MPPSDPVKDRIDTNALYERNCPDCNKKIKKGQRISIKVGQLKYRHIQCFVDKHT